MLIREIRNLNFSCNFSYKVVVKQDANETYAAIMKSHNIFVAANVASSRLRFYFLKQLWQHYNLNIFEALHSVSSPM